MNFHQNHWQVTLAAGLLLPLTAAATHTATSTNVRISPRMETLVVHGERVRDSLEAERVLTPGAVTIVDNDALYQRNVSSLADMLRYVPGIWAVSNSGTDSMFFSSRGSNLDATNYDMNGIKLLQDGLPVTTADGNNHNRIIDPLSAHYASVARGANALTYGASTLGGAIDFISPTAHNSAPLSLFLNGGSHGQMTTRVTASSVFNEQFDGLITLENKQWDGYRDHNEQDRQGLYANLGWQINETVSTRLFVTYVDNEQELPSALTAAQVDDDPDQASAKAVGGHFQVNVETWRVANKTHWQINDISSLEVGLSYEEQTLYHPIVDKVLVDFDGPGGNPPVEVFSLLINTDHRDAGAMLRYNLQLDHHNLLFGINYGNGSVEGGNYRNDSGRRNGLSTDIDRSADSLEVYLMDRWQLANQWTLVYGAQAVFGSRKIKEVTIASGSVRETSDDYSSINPRLGVIFDLNQDISLFANISRLYEAPTNYELSDDVRANNETLDAMQGAVFEVGTRGRQPLGKASHWNWDLAVYYAQIRDEILSVDDPNAPGTSLSTNIDDTIHAGIEALVAGSFALDETGTHRLEPMLSLTVNEFSFDDDTVYGDNELPAAPRYVARGEILYRHSNGFYAGPTFDYVDHRYADFMNTYKIDSYALLGFRFGYVADHWQLYAELRNLTDREYVASHSVRDQAGLDADILNPGEPRSAYVGLQIEF